jgi:2,3-bisphosphoglycerate-dependent phosphoglycerate mutase
MELSQATHVIAIRHGETAWNVDTRIQGQLDVPLNERGRDQARRLSHAMSGERLHAVYASDLSRAHETARALARRAGLDVVPERRLRERGFGIFEGYTFKEIEERWPEQSQRWRQRDPAFGPEGGETLAGFYERAVSAATALAQAHPGQTIALVAHGGVMDCLYRAASRIALQAPRTWHLGNASINRLLYTQQGFTLIGWNDDRHLDDPSLDESEGDARVGTAQ